DVAREAGERSGLIEARGRDQALFGDAPRPVGLVAQGGGVGTGVEGVAGPAVGADGAAVRVAEEDEVGVAQTVVDHGLRGDLDDGPGLRVIQEAEAEDLFSLRQKAALLPE